MAGRQAKVITPAQLKILLQHIRGQREAARSRVIILLSLRAGLRAAEIAKLEWPRCSMQLAKLDRPSNWKTGLPRRDPDGVFQSILN